MSCTVSDPTLTQRGQHWPGYQPVPPTPIPLDGRSAHETAVLHSPPACHSPHAPRAFPDLDRPLPAALPGTRPPPSSTLVPKPLLVYRAHQALGASRKPRGGFAEGNDARGQFPCSCGSGLVQRGVNPERYPSWPWFSPNCSLTLSPQEHPSAHKLLSIQVCPDVFRWIALKWAWTSLGPQSCPRCPEKDRSVMRNVRDI